MKKLADWKQVCVTIQQLAGDDEAIIKFEFVFYNLAVLQSLQYYNPGNPEIQQLRNSTIQKFRNYSEST